MISINKEKLRTSSARCSYVLFLALTLCSRLGTGEFSTTVVKPGGGRYTLQYAFSWLSDTILSPFFRSFANRSYSKDGIMLISLQSS